MTFQSKDLYVYYHKIGDMIFYVGMGLISRPFNLKGRNKRWLEIVKNYENGFTIEIVKIFPLEERKEAERFEWVEIRRLRPLANLRM